MKSLIVVSTCPRPKDINYLDATLANIDKEGGQKLDKLILSNGELQYCPSTWDYLETHHALPLSTRTNLWQSFSIAKTRNVDSLLFFEDDIVLCKNAVSRMLEIECPKHCSFVSFSDHKKGRAKGWGLQTASLPGDFDGQGYFGGQALLFPKKTIEFLSSKDPFSLITDNLSRQCDTVLGNLCAASPWPNIAFNVPSLVRHVGMVSVAWPNRIRTQEDWIPENYMNDFFDATLFTNNNDAKEHFYYDLSGWFDFENLYDLVINDLKIRNIKSPIMSEVGIYAGKSLAYLTVQACNNLNGFIIHGIDSFKAKEQPSAEDVRKKFESFGDQSPIIHEKMSVEASRNFRDSSLDFCFIDAGHTYQDVLADLTAWWPKVKRGSIFAGHDYNQRSWPGVVSAVNAFFMRAGVVVRHFPPNCWMVRKI